MRERMSVCLYIERKKVKCLLFFLLWAWDTVFLSEWMSVLSLQQSCFGFAISESVDLSYCFQNLLEM